MNAAACFAATWLIGSGVACAGGRPDAGPRKWFGVFSGGWTTAVGDTGDAVDDDFTINGAALYWPADWPAGLELELGYTNFGLSSGAIGAINSAIASDPNNSGRIDDGEVENWQVTVNGIWGPGDRNNGFYLTGGLGVYSLHAKVLQTGLTYFPPACDAWFWWWCGPSGVGQGSTVRNSDSTAEIGLNVGVGYSFKADDGQIFLEAKYHVVNTDTEDITYFPITFGYRW